MSVDNRPNFLVIYKIMYLLAIKSRDGDWRWCFSLGASRCHVPAGGGRYGSHVSCWRMELKQHLSPSRDCRGSRNPVVLDRQRATYRTRKLDIIQAQCKYEFRMLIQRLLGICFSFIVRSQVGWSGETKHSF